jgi:putative sporulation protein YtaF
MIQFVSLLILAFAVSLDSFGVGITYGLRKVLIPIRSILIIAFCSGFMIVIAMGIGQGMSYFLSPRFAEILGGVILIVIGAWALYNISRTNDSQCPVKQDTTVEESHGKKRIWTLEIKKFGIVIQVLRTPMIADIDRSGVISGVEAFVLGVALALDAFGAGIGAALIGLSPWITALLIAAMSSLFLFFGMRFGDIFSHARWMTKVSYLPGIILISFGLFKMM